MAQINKALGYNPTNIGRVVDMTPEILQIPMDWGLIGEMGIFRNSFGTQKNFMIPTRTEENVKALKGMIGQVVKLTSTTQGTKNFLVDIRVVNRNEVNEREYDLNHFQYNELRKFAPTNHQQR